MSKSDEQIEKRDRVRQGSAMSKLPSLQRRVGEPTLDYADIDAATLVRLICRVAARQGAVRYGYTRDGSAFSVGLYLGEDSKTYYANTIQEMVDLMEYLNASFEK